MRRARKTVSYRPRRSSRTSKKKKKNKIKLKLLLFVMCILLISVLMFMGWRVWFYKPQLTVSNTVWGSKLEIDASLVFNSTIVSSPRDGIVYQEIAEGDQVKSGQVIASIINKEQEKELKQKIDTLQAKLSELNIPDSNQGDPYATGGDESIHNTVRNLINNYILYRNYKAMPGMNKSIDDLEKVMNSFYNSKEQTDKDKIAYNELKEELDIAQADYEHCKVDIITNVNGVVSYKLDNLDVELAQDKFPLESHSWFLKKLNYSSISDGDSIAENQNVAKVVAKDKWWIIARVPVKHSEEYLNSDTFEVTIGEETFKAEYLSHVNDKKYLYFYYQIVKDPVVFDRFTKVILATEQIDCMEVPPESIEKADDKAYVYVRKGKVYEKIEVKILKELGNKVLINGLEDNTKILGDISYIGR